MQELETLSGTGRSKGISLPNGKGTIVVFASGFTGNWDLEVKDGDANWVDLDTYAAITTGKAITVDGGGPLTVSVNVNALSAGTLAVSYTRL